MPCHTQMTIADLRALPPTTDVPTAGRALGMSRTTAYNLVQRGEFPVPVLKLGRQFRVPTADLLALLGVDHPDATAA